MIELGLARITRLLRDTPIPWRAIHVAGTNGKGSVCAYASAMLNAGKIKCGRFTSPHLIDRWDCITINEETVNQHLFSEVETMVRAKDQMENIGASEFEVLTATAFEIFNREKIEVGIVEVGLGGRHDATNILQIPSVTVITKIGKDHQSFLGDKLEDIAYQKAGIMKHGVRCVIDGSNQQSVLEVLGRSAIDVGASPVITVSQDCGQAHPVWNLLNRDFFELHQQQNICLAFEAVNGLLSQIYPSVDIRRLIPAMQGLVWTGRLQVLSIEPLTGRKEAILIDGAHNVQSADILGSYVERRLRNDAAPVTWVIAASKGKDVQQVLSCLIRPGDNLVAVDFGPVDGMPWVTAQKAQAIAAVGRRLGVLEHLTECSGDLLEALHLATEIAKGGPLVIAGSLYLVSDTFRLLRKYNEDS